MDKSVSEPSPILFQLHHIWTPQQIEHFCINIFCNV